MSCDVMLSDVMWCDVMRQMRWDKMRSDEMRCDVMRRMTRREKRRGEEISWEKRRKERGVLVITHSIPPQSLINFCHTKDIYLHVIYKYSTTSAMHNSCISLITLSYFNSTKVVEGLTAALEEMHPDIQIAFVAFSNRIIISRLVSWSVCMWLSFSLTCFSVLCCAVLCCAVLCCAVLCCAVLCCAVMRCAVLYCTVLYCTVLYCTVLYCTVLYLLFYAFILLCWCWFSTSSRWYLYFKWIADSTADIK